VQQKDPTLRGRIFFAVMFVCCANKRCGEAAVSPAMLYFGPTARNTVMCLCTAKAQRGTGGYEKVRGFQIDFGGGELVK
jgi:hypothetical protein